MFIYVFWILDVRCTYAINFRDFQRWFLPRTVHVNVNMSWEMYVLFSPCCFVPRFSVFLWSLQIFMFAAVAVTSFCIHFRGSTYPPGHQIIESQSATIELQPLKHWTNLDYMWINHTTMVRSFNNKKQLQCNHVIDWITCWSMHIECVSKIINQ